MRMRIDFKKIKLENSMFFFHRNTNRILLNHRFWVSLLYYYSTFYNFKGGIYLYASKFLWLVSYFVFKIDLIHKSKLKGCVIFLHPIGIVIGEGVEISGINIIYQNVTLGQNKGVYCKLNDAIVYPNCVIAGNINVDGVIPAITRRIN